MCQLLCLTSHDPAKRDELIVRAWEQMAQSQKDGYGASWFGVDGQIGYHKRRYPRLNEKSIDTPPFVQAKSKPTDAFAESNDIPSDGGFIIIHGRQASPQTPILLANTHPFVDDLEDGRRVATIHNGLVKSWTYKNLLPGCTCDSELIMRAYTAGGIDGVENHIEGRYAFMHLEYTPPTEEEIANAPAGVIPTGTKRLHVAKDSVAYLYCGVRSDKTFVIATTEILIEKMGAESAGELKNHVLLVFSGKEEYEMTEFKPIGYAQKSGYASFLQLKWGRGEQTTDKKTTHFPSDAKPLGPQDDDPDDTGKAIDKDLLEAEKAEIKRLEEEAVEGYAG